MRQTKKFFLIVLVISMFSFPGWAQNNPPPGFPIVEYFTDISGWTLTGTAAHDAGNGWVQLTNTSNNQAGLAVLNTPFSSTYGITVEFDFYAGDGTGADGTAFFLVNGTTDPVTAGAFGGCLGYACGVPISRAGVPHAYVGIGFDELGNFLTNGSGNGGLPNPIPDTVTIRGSGNGLLGYNYLTHRLTAQYSGIDGGWRRARITVTQGHLISVQMSWNGGTTWVPLIENYDLSTDPGQAALPATFKLGFSAGTGAGTNNHRIDNLNVSVPVDLVVDVTQQPVAPIYPGGNVEYKYTVTNNGPNGSNLIKVTETVPAGLENVEWEYTTNLGDIGSGAGNLIDPTLDLDSGEVATFTVTGTVAISASGSLTHDVSADPGSGFNDPTPDNGSDTVVIEVLQRSLTVISPNGGENWKQTSTRNITWNAVGISGLLKITLWKAGTLIGVIADNIAPAAGSYAWKAGQLIDGSLVSCGPDYKIKIKETGTPKADSSDANFTLSPGITVMAPNGGQTWKIGIVKNITWRSGCLTNNIKITLWKEGGWEGLIKYNINPADRSFTWTVGDVYDSTGKIKLPVDTNVQYKIKIKEISTMVSDTSDGFITLIN